MNTENLSTLKIHKLTEAQYNREIENGTIDEFALYLTPDEVNDLSKYATIVELDTKLETKANVNHIHDDYATTVYVDENFVSKSDIGNIDLSEYETKEDASSKLAEAKTYVDEQIATIPTPDVSGQIATHSADTTAHADIREAIDSIGSNIDSKLSGKADANHNHNDIYYTETEIDEKIDALNSAVSNKADANHNHDNLYCTEAKVDEKIEALNNIVSGKADSSHDHNNLYYTEAEIDEKIDALNTAISGKADSSHDHDNVYYTETEIDEKIELLNNAISGKANSSHDHNNLYYTETEIDTKIDALNTAISGKASSSHNHVISEVTNLQSTLDAKVPTSRTVNGKALSSDITISASDLNVYTKTESDTNINTHNTSTWAHNDIRNLIRDLNTKLNNFLDVDDTTSDQLSEVIALIDANKGTLESLTTNKINVADIIDNLTTSSSNKVLSANQGVAIKTLIDELQEALDTHTHAINDVTGLQTALDGKSDSGHKHTVSDITDLTATATELNYMDGVTSNVQTQLDTKATTIYVDTAIQTAIGNAIAASY